MGSDFRVKNSHNTAVSHPARHSGTGSAHLAKPNLKIDGKIGHFKQSKITGNCGALAGLQALALTQKGAEIIEHSLFKDSRRNVNAKLGGVGRFYSFSPQEIITEAEKFSSGDDDVKAFELAAGRDRIANIEDLDEDTAKKVQENPLEESDMNTACHLLTKNYANEIYSYNWEYIENPSKPESYFYVRSNPSKDPSVAEKVKVARQEILAILERKKKHPDDLAITVSFVYGDTSSGHAFALESIKKYGVQLINPQNTREKEFVSLESLIHDNLNISYCDLKAPREGN